MSNLRSEDFARHTIDTAIESLPNVDTVTIDKDLFVALSIISINNDTGQFRVTKPLLSACNQARCQHNIS